MLKKQENGKQLTVLDATPQSNISENSLNTRYESSGLSIHSYSNDCSDDGKYVYTSVANTNMYMSSDYGKTWSIMTAITGTCYRSSCDYTGKYVLTRGKISRDYGVSTSALANSCYFHAIAKKCPRYMYMSNIDVGAFYYSHDYGETWTTITGKQFHSISCSEDGKYVAVSCITEQQIGISTNYGVSFTYTAVQSNNVQDVAMSSSGQYIYVSYYQTNNVSKSSDFGATFSTVASTSIGTGISCSENGQIAILHSHLGTSSYYSIDYGVSFSSFTIPYASTFGSRFKNYLYFGNTTSGLIQYLYLSSINKLFGTLELAQGSFDRPSVNFANKPASGMYLSGNSDIAFSIDATQRFRIGKYGRSIYQGVSLFTQGVTVYPFELFVPNNDAFSIIFEYSIVASKNNVVKIHAGSSVLIARNQNGTVTTATNHMSSHETEFSPADITDTFYFTPSGVYAQFGYNVTANNFTTGDVGKIYYNLRVLGDSTVTINFLQ